MKSAEALAGTSKSASSTPAVRSPTTNPRRGEGRGAGPRILGRTIPLSSPPALRPGRQPDRRLGLLVGAVYRHRFQLATKFQPSFSFTSGLHLRSGPPAKEDLAPPPTGDPSKQK